MASAVKTHPVPIRVVVGEGEAVESAYRRLRSKADDYFGRPAHKRRFGYYEKPSELGRKRAKVRALVSEIGGGLGMRVSLRLHIYPHHALWRRTGPSNSLMR